MPKIIKDVDKTIRNCATELFVDFSYSNVDMRMISDKSGIAVGTIYHYYTNKKQLYISILNESWQMTFDKLDAVIKLNISPREKVQEFVSTLYNDIEARNGLGKALINPSSDDLMNDTEIRDLKNRLVSKTELFLHNLIKVNALKLCSDLDAKLAETLIVSTMALLEFHPNNKNENICFLAEYFSLSIA